MLEPDKRYQLLEAISTDYNEGSDSEGDPSDKDSGDSETSEDEGETEAENVD